MKKQDFSKWQIACAEFSVNNTLVFLASHYDGDKAFEIADSCGFDFMTASACFTFADILKEKGKEAFERHLIVCRNIYYQYNGLIPKKSNREVYCGFFDKMIGYGYSYKFQAIKSIEILEKFAGGRLLVQNLSLKPTGKTDASLSDYIKTNKCYKEDITIYFENYPDLLFSFEFFDNPGTVCSSFTCFIRAYDRNFEMNEQLVLSAAPRQYYNVPQYFNNKFIQFMSRALFADLFDSQYCEHSIALLLIKYLESKNVLLPDLQYEKYLDRHKAKTEIEKITIESSKDIESLSSLIKRINKMEIERGVKPQYLTFLNFYLKYFIDKEKRFIIKHTQKENLKKLEQEHLKSLQAV